MDVAGVDRASRPTFADMKTSSQVSFRPFLVNQSKRSNVRAVCPPWTRKLGDVREIHFGLSVRLSDVAACACKVQLENRDGKTGVAS